MVDWSLTFKLVLFFLGIRAVRTVSEMLINARLAVQLTALLAPGCLIRYSIAKHARY